MDKDVKFAVVGGGNMAASLIGGLISDGCSPDRFCVADPDPARRSWFGETHGIAAVADNDRAAAGADVVVLAVKPQVARVALQSLGPVDDNTLYLSVIAGIRETDLRRWLDTRAPIVRAMPNTPALLGCGVTALFADASVPEPLRELAEGIMRASGAVVWVGEESLLDPVTALSGSGPAYFFLLMEVMNRTGVEMGLAAETARLLTLDTALGAARMALESDADIAELRTRVTSPGGTTAAAINVLEARGATDAIREAILAARNRARELALEYGEK
jgi:pyrroline-5-carboxylate reductase